ncbi:hypothetical protein AV955_gp095 [Diadromus pulchellus ascovirus 4a]|uniref:Complete DpAV4 genome n=1 Tax=Diadromus pulchellus ascovirus 4a TaxID=158683 RepID=F2NZ24_9VIRU|nr:hypothetical protein AV955_gp095 [Diadromus pulchellus ascovirus 4a]CCA61452.1 unnamed protein product [Diadromus pulchellus ascovirus 4a]
MVRTKFVNAEEFLKKVTPCKNGRFCNVEGCRFKHDLKTKMCKFAQRCRQGTRCPFAHTEAELYKPMCRFGARCNNRENCRFDHPKQPKALDVSAEPKKNTVPKASDFPSMKGVEVSIPVPTCNYSEIRKLVHADRAVIKGETIDDLVKDYDCLLSYNTVLFEL